eukprot:COSAG01_NODE_707_length_14133_cov_34.324093_12_plen_213_part_00
MADAAVVVVAGGAAAAGLGMVSGVARRDHLRRSDWLDSSVLDWVVSAGSGAAVVVAVAAAAVKVADCMLRRHPAAAPPPPPPCAQLGAVGQDTKPYIAVITDGSPEARSSAGKAAELCVVCQPAAFVAPVSSADDCCCVDDGDGAALTKAYASVRNSDGSMDNIMSIHSLNPATMHSHAAIYMQCMKGESPLSKVDREIIAVVSSLCNRCTY